MSYFTPTNSSDVSTTDDEQDMQWGDDDGEVGSTNLGSGGGTNGGGGSSSNVGDAAAAAKASAAAALLKQANDDSFIQQRDAHFGTAEDNERVLATLAAPAVFLSQQGMQEAVHSNDSIQPGYGNADQLPSIEEWIAILMQSDNVVVKTKLVSLIGQHDNWFFGPKLENVFAAVVEVRNREL